MSSPLVSLPGLVSVPPPAPPGVSSAPVAPGTTWATLDTTIIFRIQSFLPENTILPVNKHWRGATRFKRLLETIVQTINPRLLTPKRFEELVRELANHHKQPPLSVAVHLYETIMTAGDWQLFMCFQSAIQEASDISKDGPFITNRQFVIKREIDRLRPQIFKLGKEKEIALAKYQEAIAVRDKMDRICHANAEYITDQLTCSIWLDEIISLSERVDTACFHVFHEECINKWRSLSNNCPNCHGNLDAIPDKDALAKHKNAKDALLVKRDTGRQAADQAEKVAQRAFLTYQYCLSQFSHPSKQLQYLSYQFQSAAKAVREERAAQAAFLKIFLQEGQAASLIRALRENL